MLNHNVRNRVLVKMLGFLDAKQLDGFRDYLNCNLFNTNETLVVLFGCIHEKCLVPQLEFLSEEELLLGSGINPALLDKLCSLLMRQLRGFVPLWQQRPGSGSDFPIALEAWRQMGLEGDLLEKEYRKMKRKLDKIPATEFGHWNRFRLEHVFAQYKTQLPRKERKELFRPAMALLDEFYAINKLKYLCATISLDRVFQNDAAVDEVLLTPGVFEHLPALGRAYQRCFLLLRQDEPAPEQVQELLELVRAHGSSFSRPDHSDLYGYLLNISIRGLASREPPFEHLLHQIYNSLLKEGLLMEAGRIAGYHFKNIVSSKLRIGALKEAEEFIESHADFLSSENKGALLPYSKGQVAFASLDFRKAVKFFRLVVNKAPADLIIGVEARKMLWKSLFELYDELSLDEYHEMVRLYDSFRTFIARNNQLSADLKESYENFIRIFNRLIGIGERRPQPSSMDRLQNLYEETRNCEQVSYKKWLLEAIERRIQLLKE